MLNWLLLFVPLTLALEYLAAQQHLLIFISAAVAIIPLAGWLGQATEQLAERSGEGVGGLLNATFGNATELIIAIAALRAGLHDVVKASLAGSIIGNILLVLGAAMLCGGLKFKEQHFNSNGARGEPPCSPCSPWPPSLWCCQRFTCSAPWRFPDCSTRYST